MPTIESSNGLIASMRAWQEQSAEVCRLLADQDDAARDLPDSYRSMIQSGDEAIDGLLSDDLKRAFADAVAPDFMVGSGVMPADTMTGFIPVTPLRQALIVAEHRVDDLRREFEATPDVSGGILGSRIGAVKAVAAIQ